MSSANTRRPTPLAGHIHLVLFQQVHESFYLEIPVAIIQTVCLRPCKYLRYLGWCVLGVEGSLQDEQRHQVELNGNLVDQGTYHYRLPVAHQDALFHAVDPEVIKLRSQVPFGTTATRENFREALVERDGGRCVWTGFPPGVGMHIIPFSKGDEWLQLIIDNRPHNKEGRLGTLKSINDIRNGIIGANSLHSPHFDSRAAVILKTPNPILRISDVPPRHNRVLPNEARYPTDSRYTLQWLVAGDEFLFNFFPNNSDASFVSLHKPKPAEILLHYNYGAAAVKQWGRNYAVLNNRPGLPRPQEPVPASMGSLKTVSDRTKTTDKLAQGRTERSQRQDANNKSSVTEVDSEQLGWDEHDVMLFFWGNSKASTERHAEKERERDRNISTWRSGIAM